MRRTAFATAFSGLAIAGPVAAADITVTVEIPKLTVAEYHRPFVALWVENAEGKAVKTLAVWYDVKGEGENWLKDIRTWWRKAGRETSMPADGISGATRSAGRHQLNFAAGKGPLGSLPPGSYTLVAEAAREVGGREMLKTPFTWPPKKAQTASVKGQEELGGLSIALKP